MNTASIDPESFVFGKDFNAEQRAAFDAMAAERGLGMDASLLNQDRSIGNVDGTDYYNAIRDEAIKPNNILNGYLGIQEIPNLMANGSSTRGSRGNNNLSSETLTDAEFEKGRNKFIDLMTPYSDTNMRNGFTYTADDDSGSFVESDIPLNMMSNGSNSGRGVDTSLSNTIGRDVASGMGDGLNNVMRMTENIQSKYGDPNDKTVLKTMDYGRYTPGEFILTNVNFTQLLAFHLEAKTSITMCVRNYTHQIPYGVVGTNNHLLETIERNGEFEKYVEMLADRVEK